MIITKTPQGTEYQNNSKTFCVELHVVEDGYFVVFRRGGEATQRVFRDKTNAIRYVTYLINGE